MGIVRDYPREPLLAAVRIATHYGLDDMDRLESLVLRHIAGDFFPRPPEAATNDCGTGDGADDDDHDEPDGDDMPAGDDIPEPEDDDDR